MRETVIRDMYFGLTQNTNNLKVTLFTEDMNSGDQPITIATTDAVLYLLLCHKKGNDISLQKNGDYWNLIREHRELTDYWKAFFNGKVSLKGLFEELKSNVSNNLYESFNYIKNIEKTEVTSGEMEEMAVKQLDTVLKFADVYNDAVQNSKKNKFGKYLREQSETTKAKQTFDYTAFIGTLAEKHAKEFNNNYIIVGE